MPHDKDEWTTESLKACVIGAFLKCEVGERDGGRSGFGQGIAFGRRRILMWVPKIADWPRIAELNLEGIMCGKTPMAVIRGFYGKKECRAAASKINAHTRTSFQDGKLSHIGPFLMAYATNKKEYFKKAAAAQMVLGEIFPDTHDPIPRIYDAVGRTLLGCRVSLARESRDNYSPAVIRMHGKGKTVPGPQGQRGVRGARVRDIGRRLPIVVRTPPSRIRKRGAINHVRQAMEKGGRAVSKRRLWILAGPRETQPLVPGARRWGGGPGHHKPRLLPRGDRDNGRHPQNHAGNIHGHIQAGRTGSWHGPDVRTRGQRGRMRPVAATSF